MFDNWRKRGYDGDRVKISHWKKNMQIAELIERLRKAAAKKSLRTLGRECNVSHEMIRKLLTAGDNVSITVATYNKINEGLQSHGY